MFRSASLGVFAASTLAYGLFAGAQTSRVAAPIDIAGSNVGSAIGTLTHVGLDGSLVTVPVPGAKATVIALTSTTCPLCNVYGPTLARLEAEFALQDVRFVFLNPYDIEAVEEMKLKIERLGLGGPYIHDKRHNWVKLLGAKTTTEVFLIDPEGVLQYRGAVDDQYSIGARLPAPRNEYLSDAIEALLRGEIPEVRATEAPGCIIEDVVPVEEFAPTFHGDVEAIVNRACLPCHRSGGVAPFTLESYQDVSRRAKMIEFVVKEGIMPPWFAAEGYGPWRNDGSLTKHEKETLFAWLEAGMPQGNEADAPAKPEFPVGWTIGDPDAVFQLPNPIEVKESGFMSYVNVNVPTNFSEDKWVERIEVLPGDRRAVHHILVFIRTPEQAGNRLLEALADASDAISGFFGIYVPGNSALIYPEGLAKRIPAGSVLRFQIHYTPYGKATTDQSRIGFIFAEDEPQHEVLTASLVNLGLAIPPGADNHHVEARLRVPTDVQILSFLPHMHVRGKAARYELVSERGTQILLDVPRYDFNWQLNYVLEEPLHISAGDTLIFRAWYDNSEANPANPDPTKTVRWGAQTYDEMHLGYVEYIVSGQ